MVMVLCLLVVDYEQTTGKNHQFLLSTNQQNDTMTTLQQQLK